MIDEKEWYHSKTIWGALVAVGASAFGAMGYQLDASAQNDLSNAMVQLVGAIGALVAIYGRLSATDIIS